MKNYWITYLDRKFKDAEIILATRIPQNQVRDRIVWIHTNDGTCSAKSGYRLWSLIRSACFSGEYYICRNNAPVRNLLREKHLESVRPSLGCSLGVANLFKLRVILHFFGCRLAVNSICSSTANQLEIGHVLDFCRDILHNRPHLSLEYFVRKQANETAHFMAHVSCELNC